jgi:hypothetical protein
MKLPFTIAQFLEVFRKYNTTFYPVQILFVLLAAFIIFLVFRKSRNSGRIITMIVAGFWLWMGAAYHIAFFSAINKAAYLFGSLFILEGILLLIFALTKSPIYPFTKDFRGFASASLVGYALIIYPVISFFSFHSYPYAPTFGLPCPTTIFTLAILLLSRKQIPIYIMLIPVLWSLIGFTASFTLGIYEDTALLFSGLIFITLNSIKSKRSLQNELTAK